VEGELIEESRWGAMRALRERGVSKRGIARQLGLDIKTVRKWLQEEWRPQTRRKRGRALDDWREFLRCRAPEVGFNAEVLHRELRARGYEGSYPTVARYIRPWREAYLRELSPPTVRFETAPGKQAQVDWGSLAVWLGPERCRVHLFVMVLGYSRRLFARGYRSEGLESLLDAHARAFEHFGGRTETILYDNPRTIVIEKDESSGRVVWNATFEDRMDFYGVEPRLCRFYRAQTKGKVESGVKYVKRNALAGRRFEDLESLNTWLLRWCVEVADERLHGTTHERPAERFARSEKAQLVAVDRRPPPPRERLETRVVPRDSFVAVDTNRYPVPLEWSGKVVEAQILVDEVVLRLSGSECVRHGRLSGRHQVARWDGSPRRWPSPAPRAQEPPKLDPDYVHAVGEVEVRPLATYEVACEETGR